jgi:hypothetical protein
MSSLLFTLSEYMKKIRKACKAKKTIFRVYSSPFPFLLSKGPKLEIFGSKVVLQSKPVSKRKIVVK